MKLEKKIVITGGAGFIGSQLAHELLKNGYSASDLLIVDVAEKYSARKSTTLLRRQKVEILDWAELPRLLEKSGPARVIFHMGAISNTEERSKERLNEQNYHYSQKLWNYCREQSVPFFYASSASTYGNGEHGFDDDPAKIPLYQPLNLYAVSKQEFDLWVLEQIKAGQTPARWAGFKFFNVYGAGEEHKGNQKSVLWKTKEQLESVGYVKLFESHHPDYENGGQLRDFVYVGDVCKVLRFFFEQSAPNGIYNLGSGKARSFKDLATATARALGREIKIQYVPTPESLRPQYQYFTQATLTRLRQAGFSEPMTELEDGVAASIRDERALEL